jgi:hypothetical protein
MIRIEKCIIKNGTLTGYCGQDTTMNVPAGVTSIGRRAFSTARRLRQLILPEGVISIEESAFFTCEGLTEIVLPDGLISIGDAAFSHCDRLSRIHIPDSVTFIGEMAFSFCSGLTEIRLPDHITSVADLMFSSCKNLEQVRIPDGVTSVGRRAFLNCVKLKSVNLPDSVTSIQAEAFMGCDRLESVVIPDSVTSLGEGAFSLCKNLACVTLPDRLTDIGARAFAGCGHLKKLRIFGLAIDGSRCEWEKDHPSEMLHMLRDRDYDVPLSLRTKYEFAVRQYEEDREAEAEKWIRKNALRILKQFVKADDYEALRRLLGSGILLPGKAVASALDCATEHTQKGGDMQIQALLADYKNRCCPDSDPLGSLKL